MACSFRLVQGLNLRGGGFHVGVGRVHDVEIIFQAELGLRWAGFEGRGEVEGPVLGFNYVWEGAFELFDLIFGAAVVKSR